jgi:hypothetical protein
MARRDAELVIRAKDEAQKVISSISKALQTLAGAQEDVSGGSKDTASGLLQLRDALGAVEKAYGKIDGEANKAADAFDRQKATLAETKAQYQAVTAQMTAAKAALDALRATKAPDFIGPVNTPILKATEDAYRGLVSQQSKLVSGLERQETALIAARSSLQEVSSAANAVEVAMKSVGDGAALNQLAADAEQAARAEKALAAAAAKTAQAYREQAVAAKMSAEAQRFQDNLNAAVGVRQAGSSFSSGLRARLEAEAAEVAEAVAQQAKLAAAAEKTAKAYREQAAELKSIEAARQNTAGLTANQAGDDFSRQLRKRMEAEAEAAEAVAREVVSQADAVARLRAQINPLGAAQERLNAELADAQVLYKKGAISAEELASAETHLKAVADKTAQAFGKQNATGGKGLFLGLKPYELQNLGYQVNDVFTQLASGTSLAQTAAQQGGQVLQLFPKLIENIVKYAKDPRVLALAVVLGTVALAIKRITDLSTNTREYSGLLATMADGASYSAKSLALQTRALEDAGFAADDAKKALRGFVTEGIKPEQLTAFTDAVKNLAKAYGTDLATAAAKIGPAFKGGYEAIAKLDDELNFLEPTQRAYIKSLFDAGEGEKARAVTLGLLNKQLKDGAETIKGPLVDAVKDVTDAWKAFLDWLGRTDIIQNTLKEMGELAKFAKYVAENLPGAKAQGAAGGGGLPGGVNRIPDWQSKPLPTGYGGRGPLGDFIDQKVVGGISWSKDGKGKVDVTADISAIVRTVILEAQPGYAQGQQDVAAVILNRMAATGKSGVDTVTAKNQFEPVGAPGSDARKKWDAIDVNSDRFKQALENILPVLEGKIADPTKGATLFVSPGGQKAMGRDMPSWADPSKKTLERGGHQFFTGGVTSGPGQPSVRDTKKDDEYIANLKEQLLLTGEVKDAERVRQAGLKALRDAQTAGLTDIAAKKAKELAEDDEFAKLTQERADQARQLQSDLTAMTNGTAAAQDDLASRYAAVNRVVDDYLAKLEKVQRTALPGSADFGALRAQAEANRQTLAQLATQQWYEEQLVTLQKSRADAVTDINNRVASGNLTQKQGLLDLAKLNAEFEPAMKNAAGAAVAFSESLRTAELNPKLEATIARLKTLPNDLKAAATRDMAAGYTAQAGNIASQRDSLLGQLGTAEDNGDGERMDALRQKIADLNVQLVAALESAKTFWLSLGGPEAEAAIASIDTTIGKVAELGGTFRLTAGDINEMLAAGATDGFDQFAQSLADGENAIHGLWDAFRQFAADFLRQIALMIIKQTILNALRAAGGGGGGGIGGAIASAVSAAVKHTGGIAGSGGASRSVSAALFANAQRLHDGGIPGLRAGEVPAILERDEEVLTRQDSRHVANGGLGGGKAPVFKIINAIDAGDMVQQGLNTSAGEKAILNLVRNNPAGFKAAMGG